MVAHTAASTTDRRIEDYITAITITHLSEKENYGKLSPPSSQLVATSIKSSRQKIGIPDAVDHYLYYNHPTTSNSSAKSRQYDMNLRALSEELGLKYHRHPNRGLKKTLEHALQQVNTPYVLFIEHDWEFIADVDINLILETFENYSNVNYIRFNKWRNEERGWDLKVREDCSKPIPLCKVSTYSNNPNISRTSAARQWVANSSPDLYYWYCALRRGPEISGYNLRDIARSYRSKYVYKESHVPPFDDIEIVVDTIYKNRIKRYGFEKAHSAMGTYLYGGLGDGPYVSHLGRKW